MSSFIVKADDFVTNAETATGGGAVTVTGGTQGFPDGAIIVVDYDKATGNGELTPGSNITGLTVYASEADYLAGNVLYDYSGTADLAGGPAGIGDTFLTFDGAGLVSSDPNAPDLGGVFLSPGSNVTDQIGSFTVDRQTDVDLDGDGKIRGVPENGNNQYFTGLSDVVYICFGAGTSILTPEGLRLVEEIREGDRVVTRDNGIQTVRWAGSRHLPSIGHLAAASRPVRVAAGALGNGLPERDLVLSPNHRVLLTGAKVELLYGETEVLAAAKSLTHLPGISQPVAASVTYHHFLFDRHEVVLSNGAWTESFLPGPVGLDTIEAAQRDEILALFPELAEAGGRHPGPARPTIRRREARAY